MCALVWFVDGLLVLQCFSYRTSRGTQKDKAKIQQEILESIFQNGEHQVAVYFVEFSVGIHCQGLLTQIAWLL